MAIFSDQEVMTILRDQNPWWMTGKVDPLLEKNFHRGEYYETARVFHHAIRRFPVLSGLRRVGKSSIMYQMIGDLLREGVSPVQIVYISLDTAVLAEAGLLRALHLYRETIYQGAEFYLFADEVQKDSDWASVMKHIYDTFPACKAVATGSASSKIEDKYHETAEGRLHLIKVPTLSFYEYCTLKGIPTIPTPMEDLFSLHRLPASDQSVLMLQLGSLQPQLRAYLTLGGFPEYVKADARDESYILSLIAENVINKAIYTDLSEESIQPTQLRRLFVYLCNMTSNQLNVEEMCNQLGGMSPITAAKYLNILEYANLIYRSWPVLQDGKKALKAQPKVYIADSGIRESIVTGLHAPDDAVQLGYMVESAAYKHTADYCHAADPAWWAGYLRPALGKKATGQEVDIALCTRRGIVQLVESKYRNQSTIKDQDMIISEALADTPGYVITKDVLDFGLTQRKDTQLYRIPAPAYLYLMGRMQHRKHHPEG
ncbi:MAG: ATP-binding protein [Clostridia bacterium]|nr:ATP-binding protein [Clostridia bacterium]